VVSLIKEQEELSQNEDNPSKFVPSSIARCIDSKDEARVDELKNREKLVEPSLDISTGMNQESILSTLLNNDQVASA